MGECKILGDMGLGETCNCFDICKSAGARLYGFVTKFSLPVSKRFDGVNLQLV